MCPCTVHNIRVFAVPSKPFADPTHRQKGVQWWLVPSRAMDKNTALGIHFGSWSTLDIGSRWVFLHQHPSGTNRLRIEIGFCEEHWTLPFRCRESVCRTSTNPYALALGYVGTTATQMWDNGAHGRLDRGGGQTFPGKGWRRLACLGGRFRWTSDGELAVMPISMEIATNVESIFIDSVERIDGSRVLRRVSKIFAKPYFKSREIETLI